MAPSKRRRVTVNSDDSSGEEKEEYPITLKYDANANVKKEASDDEYRESEFEDENEDEGSTEGYSEEASDGGFIVDSDGNDVRGSYDRPARRRRSSRATRSAPPRTRRLTRRQAALRRAHGIPSESGHEGDTDSVAEEFRDLHDTPSPSPPPRELRARRPVSYAMPPPPTLEEVEAAAASISARHDSKSKNKGPLRRLFNVRGPFGGADVVSLFNPSENELRKVLDEGSKSVISTSQSAATTADSDPLGIETDIDFSAVGGLDDYIDKLKEMVQLPLMYPNIYKRFAITPPRGVLFHGPPGTGKTLMARALASSCSKDSGKKVTFFMRKGADCLSKWIGEAERQLRLLFEEAKAHQPSIIFFDEIDGLAPVRSSKQEQIHASIVSTLLALMDGMDNRGQVVVIGATNRPDSVDPALRRPGRFDREFYFPLPNLQARRRIIEIHTTKWDPPLPGNFLDKVASLTKGYGGADIRALCTESALIAIQRAFPQIYATRQRLLVDPSQIKVEPADFMAAIDRIQPSSMRENEGEGPRPLPDRIEPLLRDTFSKIKEQLDSVLPRAPIRSSLEQAIDSEGISFEVQQRYKELQASRVYRPRLLVHGPPDHGQEYLAAAIANYLEGVNIQYLSLPSLLGDTMKTPEATIVQVVAEARRRTPSCILIPDIDAWTDAVSPQVFSVLVASLRSCTPSEPVLVVGISNTELEELNPAIVKIFGLTTVKATIDTSKSVLSEFFALLRELITKEPPRITQSRQKIPELPLAPEEPVDASSAYEDPEEQRRKDIKTRSQLKVKLGSLLDGFKNRYRRFRKPAVDDMHIAYLFETEGNEGGEAAEEQEDHEYVRTGDDMILEVSTEKKFYNMDLDIIEDRLWNGYYCEPSQFLKDIEMIHADSVVMGDRDRMHKSSELLANTEVALDDINEPEFLQACRDLHIRSARRLLQEVGKVKDIDGSSTQGNSQVDPQGNPEESSQGGMQGQVSAKDVENQREEGSHHLNGNAIMKEKTDTEAEAHVLAAEHAPANAEPFSDPHIGPFKIDLEQLNSLFDQVMTECRDFSLGQLELIYSGLVDVAWQYRNDRDRTAMLSELQKRVQLIHYLDN